jgi:diguanylate cyclase (GGDEF)-like protein
LLAQIPVDRLGAATRQRLDAARSHDDDVELRAALRQATGELLRGGHLMRVSVDGAAPNGGPFFLLRGTSSLLDLSSLSAGAETGGTAHGRPPGDGNGRETPMDRAPDLDPPSPPPMAPEPVLPLEDFLADEASAPAPQAFGDVLDAMERAQDLAVGDPRANDPMVVVERILALLARYAPSTRLFAHLNGVEAGDSCRHLVASPSGDAAPFWLRHRRPGQGAWISRPEDLPAPVRTMLDGDGLAAQGAAAVPLWSPVDEGTEIGVLYVVGVGEWTRDALGGLARRLSAFVTVRWRCQRDVNRRVLTDSLTGIHNRAFFDTYFPLELERARRGDFPLTLVIGDLDHFKAINDTCGHQCGDYVLREVAQRLQATLRRIDYVCRIGGEEFALILPYTSGAEARDVLVRLVRLPFDVAMPAEFGGGRRSVTMSYGVVTFPEAGNSAGELHRKADSMLYHSKEQGRNRCWIWQPDGRHQQISPDGSPGRS